MGNMAIANTILQQLGGGRFTVMTGAKHLLAHNDGLSFQLPARFAAKGINYVKVTLDPSDTYTLKFSKINARKYTVTDIAEYNGIYCDQLQQLFTRETGLDTHL